MANFRIFLCTNEHKYKTRAVEKGVIKLNPNFRTSNNKSFAYFGTQMLNEMKINSLYNPILRKNTFTFNVKKEFVNNY